jgi:hypothetical protein
VSPLVTLGPVPFFPVAGAVVVGGDPGAALPGADSAAPGTIVKNHSIGAFPQLRVSVRACGRRTFGLYRQQMAPGGMDRFSRTREAM